MLSQNRTLLVITTMAATLLFIGCGEAVQPMPKARNYSTEDAGTTTSDASTPDAGEANSSSCNPKRLVFLGDSIPACTGVGGKEGPQCGPKVLFNYVKENMEPTVSYENLSNPGDVTEDVAADQIFDINVGDESILVVLYAGGNDLQPYIFASDERANNAFNTLKPEIEGYWRDVFAYLNDASKFSGRMEIIINKQFNPFDDCTASPFNVSPRKSELLREFNDIVSNLAAEADNIYVADQHTPFLGHGHHYRVSSCPNYMADSDYWMVGGLDLVHPNGLGHANIANVWKTLVDQIYEDCN